MLRTALALSLLTLAAPAALAHEGHDHAHGAAVDSRFVLLEGGRNFRDVGGYRTADGETVRHGILYRAGTLGGLTAAGQAKLAGLSPVAIVDLRTPEEREHDRNADWLRVQPGYWTSDSGRSLGDLRKLFGDPSQLTGAIMRERMTDAYRSMYREQTPAYRVLFAHLVEGEGPVVLNCTAGKDRTGIGAALMMKALGAHDDDIMADYLLTGSLGDIERRKQLNSVKLREMLGEELPEHVAHALAGVSPDFLHGAFNAISQSPGGVEGYLRDAMGVDEAWRRKAEKLLLE
jgi:protein-tyrosine phosphatase